MAGLTGASTLLRTLHDTILTTQQPSSPCRALHWRLLLGLLPLDDEASWSELILAHVETYVCWKRECYGSILTQEHGDPLALGEEQTSFYNRMENKQVIELDLSRIGEDLFYQQKKRSDIILNVLFLWSMEHSRTGYRQGMHEIAAILLYGLEQELDEWKTSTTVHALSEALSSSGYDLEAQMYRLFARLMQEMEFLYDPTPILMKPSPTSSSSSSSSSREESYPPVVHYLTKMQETYLDRVDPELCHHLRACDIHAQFYGLRWSRLLLGREFSLINGQVLILWDRLFLAANAARTTHGPLYNIHYLHDDDDAEEEDGRSPLLKGLRDVMLAMLVLIRDELLAGDTNTCLMFLMKYPPLEHLASLLALVEQIRRALASGRTLKEMEAISQQYTATAAAAAAAAATTSSSVHCSTNNDNDDDDDVIVKAERSSMHSHPDGMFEDVALESSRSPAPARVLSTMPAIPQQPAVPHTRITDTTTTTTTTNNNDSSSNQHRPNGLFNSNHSLNGGLFADISSATGSLLDQMLLHTTNNDKPTTLQQQETIRRPPIQQENNNKHITSSLFSLPTFDFLDLNDISQGGDATTATSPDKKAKIPKGKLDLFDSDDVLDDHR